VPIFNYRCPQCSNNVRRHLSNPEDGKREMFCPKCNEKLDRAPTPPDPHVIERLDNGAMPRAVERFADAERLMKEREDKNRQN
jgi:DNA-directed RNA polymerase subunit RPC12/RpoP